MKNGIATYTNISARNQAILSVLAAEQSAELTRKCRELGALISAVPAKELEARRAETLRNRQHALAGGVK